MGRLALGAGALAMLVGSLVLTASSGAALAESTSTTPLLHWDAGMLPTGAANTLPEGPVGMRATVHGSSFKPSAHVRLGLVKGDSTKTLALCAGTSTTTGDVIVESDGTFDESFYWPKAAGTVDAQYSLCAYNASTGHSLGARTDGPFTVLAASEPIVILSQRSAGAGGSVTVSGRNYVPPQSVTITLRPHGGSAPLVTKTVTSSGRTTGTFSTTLALPAGATAGSYTIAATAQNGRIGATAPGALTIAGTAHATTPAPTAAPKPTAGAHSTPDTHSTPTTHATPGATATAGATAGATHTPGANTTPGATTTPGAQSTAGTAAATAAPTHAGQSTAGAGPVPVATAAAATDSGPDWAVIGLAITVVVLLAIIALLLALLLARRNGEREDGPPEWHLPFGKQRRARASRPVSQRPSTPLPADVPAGLRALPGQHASADGQPYDAAWSQPPEGEWQPYTPGSYAPSPYAPSPYAPSPYAHGTEDEAWQAQPSARDPLEGIYYAPADDVPPSRGRYEAPFTPRASATPYSWNAQYGSDARHAPFASSSPDMGGVPFAGEPSGAGHTPFVPVEAGLHSAPYAPRANAPADQAPAPPSAPASEADPRTWVWGADLPYGPYAAQPGMTGGHPAMPGGGHTPNHGAASSGSPGAAAGASPASDVFGLPGPWGLHHDAVPTDLTLPAWRGMPPGAGSPGGQPSPGAQRQPGAEDAPHAIGAGAGVGPQR